MSPCTFRMNVDEAITYLEQLESDEEDIITADVYIEPPTVGNDETDQDSADEGSPVNLNNLNRHQLLANATVKVYF